MKYLWDKTSWRSSLNWWNNTNRLHYSAGCSWFMYMNYNRIKSSLLLLVTKAQTNVLATNMNRSMNTYLLMFTHLLTGDKSISGASKYFIGYWVTCSTYANRTTRHMSWRLSNNSMICTHVLLYPRLLPDLTYELTIAFKWPWICFKKGCRNPVSNKLNNTIHQRWPFQKSRAGVHWNSLQGIGTLVFKIRVKHQFMWWASQLVHAGGDSVSSKSPQRPDPKRPEEGAIDNKLSTAIPTQLPKYNLGQFEETL